MFRKISSPELLSLDARRICIIKPSALGDVVQTLPLLPALRERFRDASISWVIGKPLANLLEGHRQLDELIPFDSRASLREWRDLLRHLKSQNFDLVFDLQGLLRTAVLTWATGAAVRVGLETAREGSHLACNCTIRDTSKHVPAHMRYWRVAEALGVGELQPQTKIAISPADHFRVGNQLPVSDGPILAVHPGAQWVTKRWPVEKFAVVAAKAARAFGFSTIILGSAGEASIAKQMEQILREFVPAAKIRNLAGETTLKQLAAVLEKCDLLLTNDSGPMHLAAALGTPVLGIFTCTSAERSGPPGESHEFVSTQLSCAARYKKRCPYRGRKHLACMDEVEIDAVWRAFIRVADKHNRFRRAA